MPLLEELFLDYMGGLTGTSPLALFPNYVGSAKVVVACPVLPGQQEVGIYLEAHSSKHQHLVACSSEVATNSSQKVFGCPLVW